MELVKFGNDSMIYPHESTHFQMIDTKGDLLAINQTEVYLNNTIGLNDLFDSDKVYLRTVENADHLRFGDAWILNEFIPFLFEKNWPTNNTE